MNEVLKSKLCEDCSHLHNAIFEGVYPIYCCDPSNSMRVWPSSLDAIRLYNVRKCPLWDEFKLAVAKNIGRKRK